MASSNPPAANQTPSQGGYVPTNATTKQPGSGANGEGKSLRGAGGGSGDAGGTPMKPVGEQAAFTLMDEIADKLRLLDYENKFCRGYTRGALPPLPPGFFALPVVTSSSASSGNSNNRGGVALPSPQTTPPQFFYFSQLFAWLAGLCGRKVSPAGRSDDPNSVAGSIVAELKVMGFNGEMPPSRVRLGYGEVVCSILNQLLGVALTNAGFRFENPHHEKELQQVTKEDEFEEDMVDEAEPDELDERPLVFDNENEHEDALDSAPKTSNAPGTLSEAEIQAWQVEVERVSAQLKVQIAPDTRDWRTRRELLNKHHSTISSLLPSMKPQLQQISTDIATQLTEIESHERHLNSQLSQLVAEYRAASAAVNELQARYMAGTKSRDSLLEEISEIDNEIAAVNEEMEMYKSALGDNKPVLEVKTALKKIETEIHKMDTRIGVVENAIMTSKMHERRLHPTALAAVEADVDFGVPQEGSGSEGNEGEDEDEDGDDSAYADD
ncbi:intraflagellar transport protein 57-like [Pelomyxa schiedti]|nr:intraflagellar transport protein 57-like [Pelomyxa schiedti]